MLSNSKQIDLNSRPFNRDETDFGAPTKGRGYGHVVTIVLIVLLAFAIRYWFNFAADHSNNYGAADASEYLRNAQALFDLKNLPTSMWSDCWAVLSGKADAATIEHVRQSLSPLKDFYISGPTFPLFLTSVYAIGAGRVDILNWEVPLFAQSIISALTCGFIALGGGLAYSRTSGYLAGLLAAFYPAFIVNSGRLYSETFAAFLLSAIIYLTVRGFCRHQGYTAAISASFWNGICAAALQFTRSVMVIISVALVPIAFMQYGFKKGMVAVFGLLLGFAAIALPWLAVQKLAFGSASLVVDRVGNYNFFVGNNTETAGWLSYPYPDGRGIEEKSMLTLAQESIGKNPRRWLQLMEDKPLRLFKFPWNDFRTAIGPVEFKWQVLAHELIVVLALIGAALGLVSNAKAGRPDFGYERPGRLPKDQTTARLFLLFVVGVHLAYLFFITVPRYNLTAMPVLIIFAAAGITSLARLFVSRGGAFACVSIVFAIALLFAGANLDITSAFATAFGIKATFWGFVFKQVLIFLSIVGLAVFLCQGIGALSPPTPFETRRHPSSSYATFLVMTCAILALPFAIIPAAANGRWYEWKQPLDQQGALITQKLRVTSMPGRQLYLLIDADGINTLHGVSIQLNGKPLSQPLIPGISLVGDFERMQVSRGVQVREGEWIYSCMTESVPMRNSDLRQWFLVPIPAQQPMTAETSVTLRKNSVAGGGTIYGAYSSNKRYRYIPSINTTSWEKSFYGVANAEGLEDPRYDMRVDAEKFVDSESDLSSERGLQTGSYNIRLLASAPLIRNNEIHTVELPGTTTLASIKEHRLGSPSITDRAQKSMKDLAVPPYGRDDLWFVRCTGTARRSSGNAELKFALFANTDAEPYSSPWTPNLPTSTEATAFDFAVPLKPAAIKNLRNLQLTVTSSGTAARSGRDARAPRQSGQDARAPRQNGPDAGAPRENGLTEISDLTVQILKAPSNPVGPGSTVL